jgi:pimeloyl-ACP methyl ester carboxylesterase
MHYVVIPILCFTLLTVLIPVGELLRFFFITPSFRYSRQKNKGKNIQNPRKYGRPPFRIALVHGGPGAGGEMAPVARKLASDFGILEPLQTANSIEGQVQELKTLLEEHARIPVTLAGFSWGAWLSFILSANYPALVAKLILIGSGSFVEKYVTGMNKIRMNRLNEAERTEIDFLQKKLKCADTHDQTALFARFGEIFSKADAFYPVETGTDEVDLRVDIFQKVWPQAAELRKNGELLGLAKQIECPVVAFHGDYDPHPAEGVEKPLAAILNDFQFILLKNCGHKPWIERQAKDDFFRILTEELHNTL